MTGHTGFKGSWLCLWLKSMDAEVIGISLEPPTVPNHWDMLALSGIDDIRLDIGRYDDLRRAMSDARPELLIHMAAQPLVRQSYEQPLETFRTNVMGTAHVLDIACSIDGIRAAVNVTTDKVYRASNLPLDESAELGAADPYSTSKACSELITDAYRQLVHTRGRGPRLATARAGNVVGGGDWSVDRLIPDAARAVSSSSPLSIRLPHAVRPWQHVLDALSGYLMLSADLLNGKDREGAWNFGPQDTNELAVRGACEILLETWPTLQLVYAGSPPSIPESEVLKLDSSKARSQLGWKPVWRSGAAIRRAAAWYKQFIEHGHVNSENDLREFIVDAEASGVRWVQ